MDLNWPYVRAKDSSRLLLKCLWAYQAFFIIHSIANRGSPKTFQLGSTPRPGWDFGTDIFCPLEVLTPSLVGDKNNPLETVL